MLRHTIVDDSGVLIDRKVSLGILGLSSLLAILWSQFDSRHALWLMALNALAPFAGRWLRQRSLRTA